MRDMLPTPHVYLEPAIQQLRKKEVERLISTLSQKRGQRIEKAPGKYVVLGGGRTTRLKSREPVDWSSI